MNPFNLLSGRIGGPVLAAAVALSSAACSAIRPPRQGGVEELHGSDEAMSMLAPRESPSRPAAQADPEPAAPTTEPEPAPIDSPIVELDESPVVELDESPVVELDESPVVELDESPVVELDEPPVIELDEPTTGVAAKDTANEKPEAKAKTAPGL